MREPERRITRNLKSTSTAAARLRWSFRIAGAVSPVILCAGRVVTLPEFTPTGDLPVGVHLASLAETVARFGIGSDQRKRLARRLKVVHQLALETGHLARFVIFGSSVTDKQEPNDVDVFLIMDDNLEKGSLQGEARLLFGHGASHDHFGCSVFWVRRLGVIGGEESAIEDGQIKRDGSERGIVEITVE